MRKLVLTLIALTLVLVTLVTPAIAEEDTDGACTNARNTCLYNWSNCRNANGTCEGGCGYGDDPVCDAQYDWCINDLPWYCGFWVN